MRNITGVVGVQCGLFYKPNNFNVKVRLFIPVSAVIKIFIAHLAGNCWSTPTTQNNKSPHLRVHSQITFGMGHYLQKSPRVVGHCLSSQLRSRQLGQRGVVVLLDLVSKRECIRHSASGFNHEHGTTALDQLSCKCGPERTCPYYQNIDFYLVCPRFRPPF